MPPRHGLECGAHGHLGLAEADIAAHQAVHGQCALHVLGHLVNGALLIRRLTIREPALQLTHQVVVGRKGNTLGAPSGLVEGNQFTSQLAHSRPGTGLHRAPCLSPQLAEGRGAAVGTHVTRHLLKVIVGHVQAIVPRKHEREVVPRDVGNGAGLEALEASDSLILVHHMVADLQVQERRDTAAGGERGAGARTAAADECAIWHHRQTEVAGHEAAAKIEVGERHGTLSRNTASDLHDLGRHAADQMLRALHVTATREAHHQPQTILR